MWKTPEIARLAASIGATPAAFQACLNSASSFEEAEKNFEELKKRIKKSYHEKSLELHPDRTGGDKGKEEQFKLLSSVYGAVQKLKLIPRQRPRPVCIRVMNYGVSITTNTTGTTTSWW